MAETASTGRIYMSSPDVTESEKDAVRRALDSGWIAPLGPEVDAFERELAEFCGRRHAVALSSGTAALHLGLLDLGVRPGQVVVSSSMTFAATANSITYANAEPVFVDADESGSMNPALLRVALADQRAKGADIAAVLPVDLLGKVVDHEAIATVAAEFGVPVVSDAAESLGAMRHGRPAASYGDWAGLSFNGNKIMTTSGGGALLTDDEDLAKRTRYLATQARQPALHYEHTEIGYNYRLSNLLAALGRAQLERLPAMLERRRQWRLAYKNFFAPIDGVSMFSQPDGAEGGLDAPTHDNFWLTSIVVDPAVAGFESTDLIRALAAAEIESRPLWKPMHLQPVFAGKQAYIDGTSQRLFETGVSLPSGSVLTDADFQRILQTISAFLDKR